MHRKQFLHTSLRMRTTVLYALTLAMALFLVSCAGGQVKKKEPVYRLGVQISTFAPLVAHDLGLPEDIKGVLVMAVSQGSPAATAGVRSGDVIAGIKMPDGKLQETPDTTALLELLKKMPIDRSVALSILRDGKTMDISSMRSTRQFSGYVQPGSRPEPRTIKVAPDGSGDCRTITGAMLSARPGDTILLSRAPGPGGVYGSFQLFLDNLTVRSEDPANRAVVQQIVVDGLSGVKLADLEFQVSQQGSWPGVHVQGSKEVTVENCTFSGYVKAVTISGSREVFISGNRMEENALGILVDSGSEFKIKDNLITGTGVRWADSKGIYISGSRGTVSNNTILYYKVGTEAFINDLKNGGYGGYNVTGVGIYVGQGSNVSIENNIVYDNSAGIYVQAGETTHYRVEYNDIFQNTMETGQTGSRDFADYLTGSDWNISKGVKKRHESSPILSLSIWDHNYYAPNPMPLSRTNLSRDPFFNDPVRGDYRLAADSPLVGRGRGGTYIGAFPPIEQKAGTGEFK
ncbi:MAG: PDZ domain-containing protein [Deltaproteobacteria bacterium]|nr:PDZ domain-containing protein [Deltaproteobacteria bacterium]